MIKYMSFVVSAADNGSFYLKLIILYNLILNLPLKNIKKRCIIRLT